jgi:FixJ family two-component response regulator
VSSEWKVKAEKMGRVRKTYYHASEFLEDLRNDEVMDGFFLSEEAFQSLSGEMQLNHELAKKVNDMAVVLLMKAEGKKEVEDLLVMAEVAVNG